MTEAMMDHGCEQIGVGIGFDLEEFPKTAYRFVQPWVHEHETRAALFGGSEFGDWVGD